MFDVVYYITHGKRKEERVRYGMVWYGSMVWYGTVRKHALLWWKWKTELQRFKKENVLHDAQCWRLGLGNDAPGIPACVIVDFGRWAVSRRYHIRIQEDRIVFYEGGEGCEGWVHLPYLFIQKRNNGRQLMDELHTDNKKITHLRFIRAPWSHCAWSIIYYAWNIWKALQGQTIKSKVVVVIVVDKEREHVGTSYESHWHWNWWCWISEKSSI